MSRAHIAKNRGGRIEANERIYARVVAIIVPSLRGGGFLPALVGCVEQTDESELAVIEQSSIWYQRNVDQIRGQMLLGTPDFEPHLNTRKRNFVAALHARGAGRIIPPSYQVPPSCGFGFVHTGVGSGTLTSSSRLMTAHHVVYPALFNNEADPCSYEVVLEGALNDDSENVSSHFAAYTAGNDFTEDLDDATPRDEFYSNKCDNPGECLAPPTNPLVCNSPFMKVGGECVEENPLLALRLFQLGLESWATDSNWKGTTDEQAAGPNRRHHLHNKWPFQVDWDRVAGAQPSRVEDALAQQGQMVHPPDHRARGRDLAFLEACALQNYAPTQSGIVDPDSDGWPIEKDTRWSSDPSKPAYTPSARFPMNRPGIFFNTTHVRDATEHIAKLQTDYKDIYAVHTNKWPDDHSTWSVPLVSRPGKWRAAATCGEVPEYCASNYDTPETFAVGTSEYRDCVDTTLDAAKSSSGGMVLSPVLFDNISPRLGMNGAAIFQGGAGPAEWASPFPKTTSEDDEPNTFPKGFMAATLADSQAVAWAKRDHGAEPFAPRPVQPDKNGPWCTNCRPWANNIWGVPPTGSARPPALNPVEPDTPPDEREEAGDAFDTDNDDTTLLGWTHYCDYRGSGFAHEEGVAVGVVGSLTTSGIQGVGSLRLVCAPWSSVSYTENWPFLKFVGRRLPQGDDTLETGWAWWSANLPSALSYMYEHYLGSIEPLYRPASMKLCPPNFYLQGIVSAYDTQDDHLKGVTHLICARAPASPAPKGYPERICVSLSTDGPSLQYCRDLSSKGIASATYATCGADCYDDFTLAGNSFPLDQQIGLSNATPNTEEDQYCPEGTAIYGMKIYAYESGPVRNFYVNCVGLPK